MIGLDPFLESPERALRFNQQRAAANHHGNAFSPVTKRHLASQNPVVLAAFQAAQQESFFTSLEKVWAHSFRPSTMVRYGNS